MQNVAGASIGSVTSRPKVWLTTRDALNNHPCSAGRWPASICCSSGDVALSAPGMEEALHEIASMRLFTRFPKFSQGRLKGGKHGNPLRLIAPGALALKIQGSARMDQTIPNLGKAVLKKARKLGPKSKGASDSAKKSTKKIVRRPVRKAKST